MEQIVSTGNYRLTYVKLKIICSLMSLLSVVVPFGIVAAYLAKAGKKVALFDRVFARWSVCGGAMMFNDIVVQEEAMQDRVSWV